MIVNLILVICAYFCVNLQMFETVLFEMVDIMAGSCRNSYLSLME